MLRWNTSSGGGIDEVYLREFSMIRGRRHLQKLFYYGEIFVALSTTIFNTWYNLLHLLCQYRRNPGSHLGCNVWTLTGISASKGWTLFSNVALRASGKLPAYASQQQFNAHWANGNHVRMYQGWWLIEIKFKVYFGGNCKSTSPIFSLAPDCLSALSPSTAGNVMKWLLNTFSNIERHI